ncbi:type III-B CRISPR module RAMP protein Cmr4 [uncultured Desulfobacter sp.]|uniref:type III-B CRISPR module RAMP protein Cmr4 n=1 Tax=uncultured Desulfobacter sp. TaxID=240139 RepID=UPI002AAB4AFE|nr:type III-B CRISPR module RAMP protein Cmr4 [uncultured Desulfobacter sp.]
MKTLLLGLLAETSIHPGAGQSADIIDLPVVREAATGYPVVPGSSFKGALTDYARDLQLKNADFIFGKQDDAGALLVSDVRLLLLPVRSLTSAYKWVTCPHLIERWQRDAERTGSGNNSAFPYFSVESGSFLGSDTDGLFLEERQFKPVAGSNEELRQCVKDFLLLIEAMTPLIRHEPTRTRLIKQLVIINDDDFAWFAKNGLGVQARNFLNTDTKKSKNLWYEEYIPADALFYAVLAERKDGAVTTIKTLFQEQPYLQLGGNETIGAGWFALSVTGGTQ